MEKQKTVFNIIRHQDGGFRFGVLCGEYKDSSAQFVRIGNLFNDGDQVLPVDICYYKNGSIYSDGISRWISVNNLGRNSDDSMALILFYYEKRDNEDYYEYAGISNYQKMPSHRTIIDKNGVQYKYTDEDFIPIIWGQASPTHLAESQTEAKRKLAFDLIDFTDIKNLKLLITDPDKIPQIQSIKDNIKNPHLTPICDFIQSIPSHYNVDSIVSQIEKNEKIDRAIHNPSRLLLICLAILIVYSTIWSFAPALICSVLVYFILRRSKSLFILRKDAKKIVSELKQKSNSINIS